MNHLSRRSLLAAVAPLSIGPASSIMGMVSPATSTAEPRVFSPLQFGAKGNGKDLDTQAVNAAVDRCFQQGGGIVYLSPGTYLCGTVQLKSNVTLYLEAGATLLGSKEISDYTAMSGGTSTHGDTGSRHLIFARDAENISITGPGTIDGQGESYWKPSGIPPLPPADAWADVIARSYAEKGERPSPMIEFVGCKWVRVEDCRIRNASSWTMRFVDCEEVQVRGVSIRNPVYGHNTDGIDITGCTNLFISDCSIDTGDDTICIKSQAPYGGQPRLTKNIVVTNCVLTTCSNGFKIGTATEWGVENITFTNSIVYNNEVDYKYRVVSGIALEAVDGGWVDGVTISNIRMQRTRTPIFIRVGDRTHPFPSEKRGIRGISIDNVHAESSVLASSITGLPGAEVRDVSLSHLTLENSFPCRPEWVGRAVPDNANGYPEARMFGMLPCSGLYVRHVRDLRVRDVSFRAAAGEARPSVLCEDSGDLTFSGIRSSPVAGAKPVIELVDCFDSWVTGCQLPRDTRTLVAVEGAKSHDVIVSGNLTGKASEPA